MKEKYKPNFNDPRVRSRLSNAIGFTYGFIGTKSGKQIALSFMKDFFGHHNTDIHSYLKSKLLKLVDSHYDPSIGKSQKWIGNPIGLSYLEFMLDNPDSAISWKEWCVNWEQIEEESNSSHVHNHIDIEINQPESKSSTLHKSIRELYNSSKDYMIAGRRWVKRLLNNTYSHQLLTGQIAYNTKSHRQWSSLQSIRSDFRVPFLASYGYMYQYDIQTCAPTLIYQYAKKLGYKKELKTYQDYLKNKSSVRTRLANECEIDLNLMKIVITSLFAGAKLGATPQYALFYILEQDVARMLFIKQDQYIVNLRKDIKEIWKYIEENNDMNFKCQYTHKIDEGTGEILSSKKKSMSSNDKWDIYYRLEEEVMTSIRQYLNSNNIKFLNEHDGFTSNQKIDINALVAHVKENTGYVLGFDFDDHTSKKDSVFNNNGGLTRLHSLTPAHQNHSLTTFANDSLCLSSDSSCNKTLSAIDGNDVNTLVVMISDDCNENVAMPSKKAPMSSTERSRLCRQRKKIKDMDVVLLNRN